MNSLTLNATAGFTGGSSSSFIDGPLIRNTAAAEEIFFPMGKVDDYHPVSVTPATASAGVYSTEFFPMATPAGAYDPLITGIATNEYWDITKISRPDATITLAQEVAITSILMTSFPPFSFGYSVWWHYP